MSSSSSLAERLRSVADKSTLVLTHRGRKTGRPYEVTIWFVVDGDRMYLPTANRKRQWPRNIQARPAVAMQIGGEKFTGRAAIIKDDAQRQHVTELLKRKYVMARAMLLLAGLFPSLAERSGQFLITLDS
jgi:deazaflavin-dependent oxidoreductase (nitroreductase family)